MTMRRLALLLVLCLPAQAQEVPRIEWAELPDIVDKAPDLRTGYLVVPENRHAPKSRSIRLPFIVEKSRNPAAPADPILFTAGGPGGSTLWAAKRRARQPLLDDRDLILLEQRGTHWAQPSLESPEIDAALRSGWATQLNGKPDPAILRDAMAKARRRFEEQGVDLAGYTTEESATDIADLRRLLGIQSLNLYGVSYSTRLMLTVLRDHPEGIRSVLLDSLLPPEANWDEEAPADILEVLDRALTAGRTDARLAEPCKDLRARLLQLLASADRRPITVSLKNPHDETPLNVRLDGAGIMECAYAGLETASGVRRTLVALDAACKGDYAPLGPLLAENLSSGGAAWGMRLSVWCNEELPFEKLSRIRHPEGLPKEMKDWMQTAVPLEALKAWPMGHPAAKENEAIQSEAPILITSGEFDPDTPTKWARAAMAHLPKAHLLLFPGMSHAPLFTHPEAARIMKAFFDDPGRAPDPGKIAELPDTLLTGMAK